MSGETGIRDLLTGLFTRDYFDEIIGRELEKSRRNNIPLSVLSIVLSNGASIRSSGGDEAFARTVIAMARTLLQNVSEGDSLFRWEEDEFIAFLPETDGPACARRVQRLASLFRPWREATGPVPNAVKVRIGAATLEKDVVFPAVLQTARAIARNQTLV
jgi:diguanylate cyclase (GGDEF)-like protein